MSYVVGGVTVEAWGNARVCTSSSCGVADANADGPHQDYGCLHRTYVRCLNICHLVVTELGIPCDLVSVQWLRSSA
jgi:hypothetical protein